jgi:monothiol glutaredoxin
MQDLDPTLKKHIEDTIRSDRVVLFMKGTRQQPRCGFSAAVVDILDDYLQNYTTVDVLTQPVLREGIKVFSEWPTIPQLYVDATFVGGADIAKEMHASGELARLLGATVTAKDASSPEEVPSVTITPAAAVRLLQARAQEPAEHSFLRVSINGRFQHQLSFGPALPQDVEVQSEEIAIRLDPASAKRAAGLVIDFVTSPREGFRIDNPQAPPVVKSLPVKELARRLQEAKHSGKPFLLFDVRTPSEFATAHIDGARLVDDGVRQMIEALPRETPLAFVCHHGGRSSAAAEHWLKRGFKDVSNVVGGTDAWSVEVDPTVPRY